MIPKSIFVFFKNSTFNCKILPTIDYLILENKINQKYCIFSTFSYKYKTRIIIIYREWET